MKRDYVRTANELDLDFIEMYMVELLALAQAEQDEATIEHLTYVLNHMPSVPFFVIAESKEKIEYIFEYISPIDGESCMGSIMIPFQNN